MNLTLDTELLREQLAELLSQPVGMAVAALLLLVYGFAVCRIFSKAGYWGPLGLMLSIPPLTLVLPLFLAFAPWPVRSEVRHLRRLHKAVKREDRRVDRRRPAA